MVFDCGIPPNYFLDEMGMFEIEALIERYNISYQNQWEQTRWIGYIIALSNGAKLTSPSELIPFTWEKDNDIITKPKLRQKLTPEEHKEFVTRMQQSIINKELGNYTVYNPL